MSDDSIREIHGVHARLAGYANLRTITLRERENTIIMNDIGDDVELTQWQARYLASRLYRLARRIRGRESGKAS